jgi:glycerophosphoryl diester phosphodiesterase
LIVKKFVLAFVTVLMALSFTAAAANAAPSPSDRDPIPPPTDYWQDKGFILMAHQGGEWNFPPNTLFAYKSAMAAGADMIDMDAYVTRDGKIVLSHDLDARNNSNLTDDMFEGRHDINDLDLDELKTLDFAYKWKPHGSAGDVEPPFRGIATGTGDDNPPPDGFTRNDFKIPTFEEVLDAFPDTPINIELKQVPGVDIEDTAETMAGILASHPGHDENVIINSFGQEMLDAMHAARPQHKSYGGSLNGTAGYINGDPITPTPVALEPPDYYFLNPPGAWLRLVPLLKPWADHDGYKIFVWGSDHDPLQDTDEFYAKLIEEGADSYNTPSPLTLATYLCNAGIAKPDGSPRCPAQECPEGQTGIAPDNCVPIDCPDGQVGTPPHCSQIIVDPMRVLTGLKFKPNKGKIKAGKKKILALKLSATSGLGGSATIHFRSSNRNVKLKKTKVKTSLGPRYLKVVVIAKKKARGKVKITATSGKFKTHSTLKVKPLKKKRHRR